MVNKTLKIDTYFADQTVELDMYSDAEEPDLIDVSVRSYWEGTHSTSFILTLGRDQLLLLSKEIKEILENDKTMCK